MANSGGAAFVELPLAASAEPAIEAPVDPATQLIVALSDALRDPLEAAMLLRLPPPLLAGARVAAVQRVTQLALPAVVARVTAHVHTTVLRRAAVSLAAATQARVLRRLLPGLTRAIALSVLSAVARSPGEDAACALCAAAAPAAAARAEVAGEAPAVGGRAPYCGVCDASRLRDGLRARAVTYYAHRAARDFMRGSGGARAAADAARAAAALGLAGAAVDEVAALAAAHAGARAGGGAAAQASADSALLPDPRLDSGEGEGEEAALAASAFAASLRDPAPPPPREPAVAFVA